MKIDVDDLVPVIQAVLVDGREVGYPGVVNQNIQAPKGLKRCRNRTLPRLVVRDIEPDVARVVRTQALGQGVAVVVEDVRDDYLGAFFHEGPCRPGSDAPCSPSDNGYFSADPSHNSPLLMALARRLSASPSQ